MGSHHIAQCCCFYYFEGLECLFIQRDLKPLLNLCVIIIIRLDRENGINKQEGLSLVRVSHNQSYDDS